jgi:hypothetical protein
MTKEEKIERFKKMNENIIPGQIVCAGSSLMEMFPVEELAKEAKLNAIIYNRGVGGFVTDELLENIDTCIGFINFFICSNQKTWLHLIRCCIIIDWIICHKIDAYIWQGILYLTDNLIIICDHFCDWYIRIAEVVCSYIDEQL